MNWLVELSAVLAAPAAGVLGAWFGGSAVVKSARAQGEADRAAERDRYERERQETTALLIGDFLGRAEALRLTDRELAEDGRSLAQVYSSPDHWEKRTVLVPNPEWSTAWVEVAGMAARIAAGDRPLGEVAWALAVKARDVANEDIWVKEREAFLNLVRQRV